MKTARNNFLLPKWFVFVVTSVGGAVIPWALWLSVTVIRIEERSSIFNDSAVSNATALRVLEQKVQDHIADPSPHAAAFRDLQRQMDVIGQRVERIEKAMVRP